MRHILHLTCTYNKRAVALERLGAQCKPHWNQVLTGVLTLWKELRGTMDEKERLKAAAQATPESPARG